MPYFFQNSSTVGLWVFELCYQCTLWIYMLCWLYRCICCSLFSLIQLALCRLWTLKIPVTAHLSGGEMGPRCPQPCRQGIAIPCPSFPNCSSPDKLGRATWVTLLLSLLGWWDRVARVQNYVQNKGKFLLISAGSSSFVHHWNAVWTEAQSALSVHDPLSLSTQNVFVMIYQV